MGVIGRIFSTQTLCRLEYFSSLLQVCKAKNGQNAQQNVHLTVCKLDARYNLSPSKRKGKEQRVVCYKPAPSLVGKSASLMASCPKNSRGALYFLLFCGMKSEISNSLRFLFPPTQPKAIDTHENKKREMTPMLWKKYIPTLWQKQLQWLF